MVGVEDRRSFGELVWKVRDWIDEDADREDDYAAFRYEFFMLDGARGEDLARRLANLLDYDWSICEGNCVEAYLQESDDDHVERFIASHPELPPLQTAYLRALRKTPASCYEVIDTCAPDRVVVRDIIRATAPFEVSDEVGSRILTPGTIFMGRLPLVEGQPVISGYPVEVQRSDAEAIVKAAQQVIQELSAALTPVQRNDPEAIEELWRDTLPYVPSVAIVGAFLNGESDEDDDSEAMVAWRFRLKLPESRLIPMLHRIKDLCREEAEDAWYWRAGSKPSDPYVALVAIREGKLMVAARSQKQVKRAVAKLERDLRMKLGKPAKSRVVPSMTDLRDMDFNEEEQQELMSRLRSTIVEALDEPAPRLGGRSVRQVAASRDRASAVGTLREIEERVLAMANSMNVDGRGVMAAVWKELGLEPGTGLPVDGPEPKRKRRHLSREDVSLPFEPE